MHCQVAFLYTLSLKGIYWPAQAELRLSKMQKKQLAVQGRENAAALALQQGRCAGIVSALQVHK